MKDSIPLYSLLAARLCHDLINPIGALDNGIEIIQSFGGPVSDEDIQLFAECSARANAILTLNRLAFGYRPSEPLTGQRLAKMLTDGLGTARLTLQTDEIEWITGPDAKILVLATYCGIRLLPKGGVITLSAPGNALIASLSAEEIAWPEEAKEMIADPERLPTSPRLIEFHLLMQALQQKPARTLSLDAHPHGMAFALHQAASEAAQPSGFNPVANLRQLR